VTTCTEHSVEGDNRRMAFASDSLSVYIHK